MANQPIGISFLPSDENAQQGPYRNAIEGSGGSDLADAFKILSLRLPQVLGARSLAPKRLLTGQGAAGIPSAFNSQSAVFEALVRNALGLGGDSSGSLTSLISGSGGGSGQLPNPGIGGGVRIGAGQTGNPDDPYTNSGSGGSSSGFSAAPPARTFDYDNLMERRRA